MEKQFTLIIHSWNPYLVPTEKLSTRPNSDGYISDPNYRTTEEWTAAFSEALDHWIARVEHYYVTPALCKKWGWEVLSGSKTKDVKKVFQGIDFKLEKQDTIQHVKAAHGSPTVEVKGLVAVPI